MPLCRHVTMPPCHYVITFGKLVCAHVSNFDWNAFYSIVNCHMLWWTWIRKFYLISQIHHPQPTSSSCLPVIVSSCHHVIMLGTWRVWTKSDLHRAPMVSLWHHAIMPPCWAHEECEPGRIYTERTWCHCVIMPSCHYVITFGRIGLNSCVQFRWGCILINF